MIVKIKKDFKHSIFNFKKGQEVICTSEVGNQFIKEKKATEVKTAQAEGFSPDQDAPTLSQTVGD